MSDLSQESWAEQLDRNAKAVVIDVRTEPEVAGGLIPDAIHIDIYKGQQFLNEIEILDRNKHYYIYCRSGIRSGQACNIMRQLGFNYTYNLVGGIEQWKGEITNQK